MLQEIFYNKQSVYEEKIAPIIKELKNECYLEKMPMFVSVAVENTPDTTRYEHNVVLASTGTALKDNRIADILLSLNEFNIDYPDYIKKDLREIEEFLERTKQGLLDAPIVETELTDDKTVGFQKIVMGGCKASMPEYMRKTPTAEDLWED